MHRSLMACSIACNNLYSFGCTSIPDNNIIILRESLLTNQPGQWTFQVKGRMHVKKVMKNITP